jgi:hypothetical protein
MDPGREGCLVSRATAGRQVVFTVRTDGLTVAAGWLAGRAAAWSERIDPPIRRKIRYCDGMSGVWDRRGRGTLDS